MVLLTGQQWSFGLVAWADDFGESLAGLFQEVRYTSEGPLASGVYLEVTTQFSAVYQPLRAAAVTWTKRPLGNGRLVQINVWIRTQMGTYRSDACPPTMGD